MGADEFWHSTLAELGAYLEATNLRYLDQIDLAKTGAWFTEALSRTGKKFPKLQQFLKRPDTSGAPPKRQTPETMLAMMKGLVAKQGGKAVARG